MFELVEAYLSLFMKQVSSAILVQLLTIVWKVRYQDSSGLGVLMCLTLSTTLTAVSHCLESLSSGS